MKWSLFIALVVTIVQTDAQTVNLKSFVWNLKSDTVSVNDIDPSDVYMALLSKKVIDEPFYRDNENKLQWVGKRDWTFETDFTLTIHFLEHEKIEMVFDGLDTYATVYLNGKLILRADNMFRSWNIDIKSLLKQTNHLRIVFESPLKVIKERRKAGIWNLPYDYGYARKAAYHFGWDWGPTFVTSGIWRPAYIRAWDKVKLDDFFVQQNRVSPLMAQLELKATIDAASKTETDILVYRDTILLREETITLNRGKNSYSMFDNIVTPELWWPNGMGDPHIYNYRIIIKSGNSVLDSLSAQIGVRKIEIVQKADSVGRSFYFKINGVPVFAKGANYIPQDNFLPRVTDDDYKNLISNVKNANMNMLRVWGGGVYEKNLFYKLCDENGIMVWQDFMFAGNMIPGDSAFIKNIKREAVENVIRLRNHPSVVLWCGNNEIDEAWHNWGWQKQYGYSNEDSAALWNTYLKVFENILPEVVKKYAPQTFYWPSSPSIGWGHKKAYRQGDVHYWEVWWGGAPFKKYQQKIGRFMSEYGFQGMPDMRTIRDFTLPADRYLGSEILNAHQKHPFGYKAIREYMERNFPVPDSLEDYVYVSQLLQAKGVSMAIEAHRRAKPYCMGTLYWQLNDCWPVVSWSSVDYYGRWKALHYRVKKDYAPFLVSFDEQPDSLRIWVVSDAVTLQKAVLKWTLMDFDGDIKASGSRILMIEPNSSSVVYDVNLNLNRKYDSTDVLLNAVLLSDDSIMLSENYHYFARPKNLSLKKPNIAVSLKKKERGYLITLLSDKLAKGVKLSTPAEGFFEDNYFDLLPNQPKKLFFRTKEILKHDNLKITTLFDVKQ